MEWPTERRWRLKACDEFVKVGCDQSIITASYMAVMTTRGVQHVACFMGMLGLSFESREKALWNAEYVGTHKQLVLE